MMERALNKIILILFFASISMQQTSAMNPFIGRTTIQSLKPFIKKGFSGSMTGLHWMIAAKDSISSGYNRIKILSDEKTAFAEDGYVDANENVTRFITSTLKEKQNIEINAVKVHPTDPTVAGQLQKHIYISQKTSAELTKALEMHDDVIISKWRGAIQHEGNHIKNNDLIWRCAADLTLPFFTHGSVKIIRYLLPFAKKSRSFLNEQLIKIPTALGKADITANLRMALYRHQEQRADDQVSNDIPTLSGLKDLFVDAEKNDLENLNHLHLSPKNLDRFRWCLNFYQTHPLPNKRIEKLEQRIALLKKLPEQNTSDIVS